MLVLSSNRLRPVFLGVECFWDAAGERPLVLFPALLFHYYPPCWWLQRGARDTRGVTIKGGWVRGRVAVTTTNLDRELELELSIQGNTHSPIALNEPTTANDSCFRLSTRQTAKRVHYSLDTSKKHVTLSAYERLCFVYD